MSKLTETKQSGSTHLVIILAVVVIVAVAACGILVYRNSHKTTTADMAPNSIANKKDLEDARKSLDSLAQDDASTTDDLSKLDAQAH